MAFIAGNKSDHEMRLHVLCDSTEALASFQNERASFTNVSQSEQYKWDREELKKEIIMNISPSAPQESIQILQNSDFEVAHGDQNDWQSSTGWGGASNPVIANDRLTFSYVSRTVSQFASVSDYEQYSNGLLSFEVGRHGSKTDSQNIYNITITFLDSVNNVIGDYRYPESGNENSNGEDWFPVSVSFPLPQGNVEGILIEITGQETGSWNGAYGPRFNFIKLFLS